MNQTLSFILIGVSCCSACSSSSATPSPTADAGADAAVPPTTASLAIDGDPNGLFWDTATDTRYVADDGTNRVLTYTDSAGFTKYADLPTAPANGPGLGQLVKTSDGAVVVVRFGYGTSGDVVVVNPDKTSTIVPNLDKAKRRIGLTVTADGRLFDGYFIKTGSGQIGSVAALSLSGTETDVVSGLQKTIGVLASGDSLFISDQAQGKLFETPLATPGTLAAAGDLPNADLLSAGPNGSVISGGSDGNVRAIDAAGAVSVVATGFAQARGVAYDAKHGRIFIANHVGTPGKNTVEIRPIP
ncbi:hypothetical protein BH09MYX1_BH09MYX1_66770 [soil metagenome]